MCWLHAVAFWSKGTWCPGQWTGLATSCQSLNHSPSLCKPCLSTEANDQKVGPGSPGFPLGQTSITITVQSKFKDTVALETAYKVWTRIQSGLPAGQLNFLFRAGLDCLPIPLNLHKWWIQTDPKCPLRSWPKPTSMHILNGCATALNQGRYTWRHDSVLQTIAKALIPTLDESGKLYADIPGLKHCCCVLFYAK